MALIPPRYLDCVVAIGFRADDTVSYVATGFLFGYLIGNPRSQLNREYRTYLVTNRHVFEGQKEAKLRFNPTGQEPAKEFNLRLIESNGTQNWQGHPTEEIDVAVINVNANLLAVNGIQFSFFKSDSHILPFTIAGEEGLTEGDPVFILGFPLGKVGEARNYVVVRQGTVARVRDTLAGSSQAFLIDALIFPGNSGGPVVTRPVMHGIEGTKSINKSLLIGLVYSYIPYQEVAISNQTNRPRITFEENSGMASVIPIDKALDAIKAKEAKLQSIPPSPVGETSVEN